MISINHLSHTQKISLYKKSSYNDPQKFLLGFRCQITDPLFFEKFKEDCKQCLGDYTEDKLNTFICGLNAVGIYMPDHPTEESYNQAIEKAGGYETIFENAATLKKRIQELENKLEQLEAEIDRLKKELEKKPQAAPPKIIINTIEVDRLTKEKEELTQNLSEAKAQFKTLEERSVKQEESLKLLLTEVSALKEQVTSLTSERDKLASKLQLEQAKNSEAQVREEKLSQDLKKEKESSEVKEISWQMERTQYRQQLITKDAALTDLKKSNTKNRTVIEKLDTELKATLEEKERLIASLNETAETFSAELHQKDTLLEEQVQSIESLRASKKNLQLLLTSIKDNLHTSNINTQMMTREAEIQRINDQLYWLQVMNSFLLYIQENPMRNHNVFINQKLQEMEAAYQASLKQRSQLVHEQKQLNRLYLPQESNDTENPVFERSSEGYIACAKQEIEKTLVQLKEIENSKAAQAIAIDEEIAKIKQQLAELGPEESS